MILDLGSKQIGRRHARVPAPGSVPRGDGDAAVSSCSTTEMCPTATMLGAVSGDTGNMKLTAAGYRAAWFRVRVREDNSGFSGLDLRLAAKVTSPTMAPFDVFVYLNAGSDVVDCSTMVGTTLTNGNVEQVQVEWGEGAIPNGADDSRDVSIEVRPRGGSCAPGQPWMLELEGNWM